MKQERTFLIGCTHFGHANIIRLANRPFEDVREMDEALIANWNATVSDTDTVYHLGDFSFGDAKKYLPRLKGKIQFLQGNHDPKGWSPHIVELRHALITREETYLRKVILCHYPIEEWDGWYRGAVHFHCHTHKHEFVSAERRGNVTVEAIGYRPIRLEEAIERLRECVQPSPTEVPYTAAARSTTKGVSR